MARRDVEISTPGAIQGGVGGGRQLLFKTLWERLMDRSVATASPLGITRARVQPMKNLCSILNLESEKPGNTTVRATKRRQRIGILFKEESNTSGVEVPVKTVAPTAMIFTTHHEDFNGATPALLLHSLHASWIYFGNLKTD